METMVVVLISVFIFGVLITMFLVGRNTWAKSSTYTELQEAARLAMDNIVSELSQSQSTQTTITACGNTCSGDFIAFKTPQATSDAIANTIFKTDGTIKWGADGNTTVSEIKYMVATAVFSSAYGGKLVRLTEKYTPPSAVCGNGITESGEQCDNGANNGACPATCSTSCTLNNCGGTCFVAGTNILMADGKTKAIENIKAGEQVMAFDEKSKKAVKAKVAGASTHKTNEYLIINGKLKVTPNHPVYANGKWVEIGSLKKGDSLLNSKKEAEPLINIKKVKLKKSINVYDLEVKKYHNYFAEGILVHNKRGGGGDGGRGPLGEEFLRNFFCGIAYAELPNDTNAGDFNIKILANDIETIDFQGYINGVAVDDRDHPDVVEITITASKKSMMGEKLQFTLSSRVSLRN